MSKTCRQDNKYSQSCVDPARSTDSCESKKANEQMDDVVVKSYDA